MEDNEIIDWNGSLVGRLKVVRRSPDHYRCGCRMWRCECRCGGIIDVYESELILGTRTSCGCQGQAVRLRPAA